MYTKSRGSVRIEVDGVVESQIKGLTQRGEGGTRTVENNTAQQQQQQQQRWDERVKKKEEESFNEGEAVVGCLECVPEKKEVVRQEEGGKVTWRKARFEFLSRGRKKI
jgi:hypothetical protein